MKRILGGVFVALAWLGGTFCAQAANITWTGLNGNAWNTTTQNWTGGATTYTDNDNVRFDETGASRTVNVTTAVSPGSIMVSNNTSSAYMFTNSAISGSGSLTKDGAGTLTLSASNSFTGGVTLSSGTLAIGNANALGLSAAGTNTVTLNGGTLKLNDNFHIFNNFSVLGTVLVDAAAGPSANLRGSASGNGTLIESGFLYGSPYGGAFSDMSAFSGTLVYSNAAGGTARFNNTGSTNMTLQMVGSSFYVSMSSPINFGAFKGDASSSITTWYASPTLAVGFLGVDSAFYGKLTDQGGGASYTLTLVKVGAGTLTLTNANTYIGGTTISNGFIAVGGSQALGTNSAVTMAGGGLKGASGGGTVSNAVSLKNNATVDTSSGDLTLVGAITNSGALTKTGSGTLTLSGTNTYTGATTVSNGTLLVNGATTNTLITVVSGATLGGTGKAGKVSIASNAVVCTSVGAAVGTLSVTNLVLAEGAKLNWKYNTGSGDLISSSGTITLPATATVTVTGSGAEPATWKVLTGSLAGATDLKGWTVTGSGAKPNMRAVRSGNDVILMTPTGFVLSFH